MATSQLTLSFAAVLQLNSSPTSPNAGSASKKRKPNSDYPVKVSTAKSPTAVGSALRKKSDQPDYEKGLKYWDEVDASVNGVLGGFGEGPVPHIDQLSSRLFLLSLLPQLHSFPNPLTPVPPLLPRHRRTALEVGAGIGRVTRNVLLPLFDDVVMLEPVEKFIGEAKRSCVRGEWGYGVRGQQKSDGSDGSKNGNGLAKEGGRGKRVWFVKEGVQKCDPRYPVKAGEDLGVVGYRVRGSGVSGEQEEGFGGAEGEVEYDAIWCQWCLGHSSTPDLVEFLKRARAALRLPTGVPAQADQAENPSLIFVKENVCEDGPGGEAEEFLDEEDSSLTRSNGKWLEIFEAAGLKVVKEEVQVGLPEELFVVKTYAMR